jgi:putative flavoprotein involved in K+ transport
LELLTEFLGIDVGIGELVHSGKVQIINGVELDHFVPDGVVFTDGRKLPVDVVIYA